MAINSFPIETTTVDISSIADNVALAEQYKDDAEAAAGVAEDAANYDYFVDDETALLALTGITSGEKAFVRDTEHVWEYDGADWNDLGEAPSAGKADRDTVPHSGSSPVSASGGQLADRYVTPKGVSAAISAVSGLASRNNLLTASSVAALISAVTTMSAEIVALKSEIADLNARASVIDYYIDGDAGDDANDGLTHATAMKSFAPLLALPAGSLDDKTIAVKRGTQVAPMDNGIIEADRCTVTTYPSHGVSRPYIDCTEEISGWTLYNSGIYTCTLTRDHSGGSKFYGNYFRDGVPMRKVESLSALSGMDDYVVYAENETTGTVTLYMTAPSDPSGDGAEYRWSKYGMAVAMTGQENAIYGIEAFGPGHQDGSLVITNAGGLNVGGHRLSGCVMWWGSRHSSVIGSGSLTSMVDGCAFYGAANEIETGGVLNSSGTANALVFNTTDHTGAVCVSRGNTYNGMGRENYIAGTDRNFTGPYGHDGVSGREMALFVIEGDKYINVSQAHNVCASSGSVTDCVFDDTNTLLITADVDGASYTLSGNRGEVDNLLTNTSGTEISITSRKNKWDILDCGAGYAGFVRSGEGASGVTNFDAESDVYNIRGVRLAVTASNRVLLNIKEGHIRQVGNTVYPDYAVPLSYLIKAGSSVTWGGDNGGTVWPIGATFSVGGTDMSLTDMISNGYDGSSSTTHAMPPSRVEDDFDRADETLASGGYTLLDGTDAMSVSSGALAVTSGDIGVYSVAKISGGVWASKVTEGVYAGGGPGIALRVLDENNWLILRENSTSYQIMARDAGSYSIQRQSSAVTPAAGQDVFVTILPYTDPHTGDEYTLAWVYVDGLAVISAESITIPPALESYDYVGFVSRGGAIDPLLSNAKWGQADQVYAQI